MFDRLNHRSQLRLMLMPYLIGVFVLVVLPAIVSFGIAFYRYDALTAPRFLGRLNFDLVRTDSLFNLSIQNTLALVVLPVPIRLFGGFLLANLALRGRWVNGLRTAIFVPSVIPSAAYALAWLWLLNPLFGPVNLFLSSIGLPTPTWLVEAQWAKPGIVLALLWQLGEGFLVSLAALHDIPKSLNDTARMDGASSFGLFRWVTLPLMAPILLILALRDTIWLLQESFTTVYVMTQGGPYYATYTLPLFIYEQGFDLLSFGTASAALWVMYLLTGVVVTALFAIARQWQVGLTKEPFLL